MSAASSSALYMTTPLGVVNAARKTLKPDLNWPIWPAMPEIFPNGTHGYQSHSTRFGSTSEELSRSSAQRRVDRLQGPLIAARVMSNSPSTSMQAL